MQCDYCRTIVIDGHDVCADKDCLKCVWVNIDFTGPGPFELEITGGTIYGLGEYYYSKLDGTDMCQPCMNMYTHDIGRTINQHEKILYEMKRRHYNKVIKELQYKQFQKHFIPMNRYLSRIIFEYT